MKYIKRAFVLLLVVLSTTILLVGCGEAKTAKAVSAKVEKETQRIVKVLNSLDSATNTDLEIKDFSPIATTSNSSKLSINSTKVKSTNINKNLTRKDYDYTLNNTGSSKNVKITYMPTKVGHYDENNNFIREKTNYTVKKVDTDILDNNKVENKETTVKTNEEKIRNFTYTPKYINSTSESFTTDNLQNYFAQIEDLFNTCSDCIASNAQCSDCKQNLINSCNNCKSLCDKVKKGEITLSDEQISKCNDCLNRLNQYTEQLSSSKGDLSKLVTTLKPLLKNYNANFWQLCQCYGKLGECLDTRIDEMNGCISCIDELSTIICPDCATNQSNSSTSTLKKNSTTKTTVKNVGQKNTVNNSNKTNSTTSQNVTKAKTINGLKSFRTNRKTNTNTNTNTKATNTSKKTSIKDKILGAMQINKNTVKANENNTMQNETSKENKVIATPQNDTKNQVAKVENKEINLPAQQTIAPKNSQTEDVQKKVENVENKNNQDKETKATPLQNEQSVKENMPNSNIVSNNVKPQNIVPNQNTMSNQPVQPIVNGSARQAQNAFMNGSNSGMYGNGVYGNGMYGNQYGYGTPRNIDSYATNLRNIDTYKNIFTNIDTYGKNFIPNVPQNEIIDDTTDNQDTNIDNNTVLTENEDVVDNKVEENIGNNDVNISSPLPNPFDPQKVETIEKEKQSLNKDNTETKEIDKESAQEFTQVEENQPTLKLDNLTLDTQKTEAKTDLALS